MAHRGAWIAAALAVAVTGTQAGAQSDDDLDRVQEAFAAHGCAMTQAEIEALGPSLPIVAPIREILSELAARGALERMPDGRLRETGSAECFGVTPPPLAAAGAAPAASSGDAPSPPDAAATRAALLDALAYAWCELPRSEARRQLAGQGFDGAAIDAVLDAAMAEGAILPPEPGAGPDGPLRLSEAECLGLADRGEEAAAAARVVLTSVPGCALAYETLEESMLASGWTLRQVSSALNVLWVREGLTYDRELLRLPAAGCAG